MSGLSDAYFAAFRAAVVDYDLYSKIIDDLQAFATKTGGIPGDNVTKHFVRVSEDAARFAAAAAAASVQPQPKQ